MTRPRSPSYPHFPLEKALGMIADIFEADRRNTIDRETAAKHIGYSGLSGAADKSLATLRQYNLLEKAGIGQTKVTQIAMDILHPNSEEDKRSALAEAGMSPDIFKDINERFPDTRPSEAALTSWLVREDFQNRAVKPIVKSYIETHSYLEQMGAFDSENDPEVETSLAGSAQEHPHEARIPQTVTPAQAQSALETAPPGLAPTTGSLPGLPLKAPTLPGLSTQLSAPQEFGSSSDAELNRIDAEIRGGTVYISALLDKEGLKKLERKISALSDFLDDA